MSIISADWGPRSGRVGSWSWAIAAVGVGLGFVAEARGQAAPADETLPRVELRRDLLLTEDRVLDDKVDGSVWDVSPSAGRRLLQLPVRVLPGQAKALLDEPAIDVSGGRFVFWDLPGDESTASRGRGRGSRGRSADEPTDAQLLYQLAGLLTGNVEPGVPEADHPSPAVVGLPEVPADAPRLARELEVLPAGTESNPSSSPRVAWELTRNIPGGEVKSGNADATFPYALLLDRDQLTEMEPERPDRLQRNANESSREFSARRRESDGEYRRLSLDYRDLQQRVRALPERFEQDLPEVVWAVYEIGAFNDGWELQAGDAEPWSMKFQDWELLTKLAGGSGRGNATGDGAFSEEEQREIIRLASIARDPHPWTQQVLATAVANSSIPGKAAENDAGAKLMAVVLAGSDPLARNRMVYALAQLEPATPAAAALLNDAARKLGEPAIQLAALRAELGVQLAEGSERNGGGAGAGVAGAIRVTNDMLAAPDGPDAGLVIQQLLAAIPDTPEADTAVIGGVRFDQLPPSRFDAAVAAALRSVGEHPAVVGGWLNHQLLGSSDAKVVRRTLNLLMRADEPAPVVSTLAQGLRNLVFGGPVADENTPDGASDPVDLTITAGLPLDSANHALFKLLNSGDPELRKQGWLVLRHFELTDQASSSRRRGQADPAQGDLDPLTMIVDAGLGRPDTPSSLVPFLARQPDEERANEPLVRVLVWGNAPASRRAARALHGSGRSFGQALAERSADDREKFADRVYNDLGDGVEPVSGLMRNETSGRGGVAIWFADELADGVLPEPAAWAEAAGGETSLMMSAVSTDEKLAAGAIAALTAAAGGDRELQYKMIDRFKDQRTTLSPAAMGEAWIDARKDIYTQRLAGAAGEYRVVITVTGTAPADGGAGIASDPLLGNDPSVLQQQAEAGAISQTERTVLGVYKLVADGQSIKFVSGVPELDVPEDRLAIRIKTPSQLKSFGAEELKDLPLDRANQPLDLLPEENGAWRGDMVLGDGRGFELLMEPFVGAEKSVPTKDEKKKPAQGGELKRSGSSIFGN